MEKIVDALSLLGRGVRDVVRGGSGVVTSINFDLYGCIQACVSPVADKEGKYPDPMWVDTNRLEVIESTRVMPIPDHFGVPGEELERAAPAVPGPSADRPPPIA